MHKPKHIPALHSEVRYPWINGERGSPPQKTPDAILDAAINRLSVPAPSDFFRIHARAKTQQALPVPNRNLALVTLVDPTTACAWEVESIEDFSPNQRRRVKRTLDSFGQNHRPDDDERVRLVCCALQRVPLEIVGISSGALASIPPEILFGLLMLHRRRPEKLWARGGPPLARRAVFSSFGELDGGWPPIEISTGDDATVTLITLVHELPERFPNSW